MANLSRFKQIVNPNPPFDTKIQISQNWDYDTNTPDDPLKGTASLTIESGDTTHSMIRFSTNINGSSPIERFSIDGLGNVTINSTGISADDNSTVTTTNATPTTLYSLSLSDNTTYMFDATIAARRTTTSAEGCVGKLRFGAYRYNSGTATLISDYSGALKEIDTYGTSNYDFGVSVSGNLLLITVTGAASETIKWVANVRYVRAG